VKVFEQLPYKIEEPDEALIKKHQIFPNTIHENQLVKKIYYCKTIYKSNNYKTKTADIG
jgi:hypothetical protein